MRRLRRQMLASKTDALFDKKQRRDEEDYSSGRSDPLRVYLRKMGGVSLLSRDGEVDISRRIEKGETRARRALLSIPFLLATLASGAVTGWLYLQAVPGEDFPIVLTGATVLFAIAFLHFMFLGLLTELIVSASRVHDRLVLDLDTIE